MKKTIAVLLVLLLGCVLGVKVYAPKGTEHNQAEMYIYAAAEENVPEVVTIYSADGRQAQIFKADLPGYLAVGWFADFSETVTTVYSYDGRRAQVFKAEAPLYLALGWYLTYAETVETLYSLDNREICVYKSEIPAYRAVGWYTKTEIEDRNAKTIALTFDDGPHPVYTMQILDVLEANGAKATFFTLGCQVQEAPHAILRAHRLGCEIGNHSYKHPGFTKISNASIQNEITKTNIAIQNITGAQPTAVRPPYGAVDARVKAAVAMPLVLWNVDTLDWKTRNANQILNHVLSYAKDGDIILMHDIYPETAAAICEMVPKLTERGFRLVTVSELAARKGKTLSAHSAYYHF